MFIKLIDPTYSHTAHITYRYVGICICLSIYLSRCSFLTYFLLLCFKCLFCFSIEEIVIKPLDEKLRSAAQENSGTKAHRYGCYQELVVKSLMHLGKFEKNLSVQPMSENLNGSGIQSLRAESDEVDECCVTHPDDRKEETNSRLPFCLSDDSESASESAENGWDSGSNFSEETKPHRVPKYILVDNRKDLLDVPEIKTEGDKFISCENKCDSETEMRDAQHAPADPPDGTALRPFSGAAEEDQACTAVMMEEPTGPEKAEGNLSLLEQAIALQAERGYVFRNTYKELDRFLLEHLAGERRQTKVTDTGGRQIFNNKRKTRFCIYFRNKIALRVGKKLRFDSFFQIAF